MNLGFLVLVEMWGQRFENISFIKECAVKGHQLKDHVYRVSMFFGQTGTVTNDILCFGPSEHGAPSMNVEPGSPSRGDPRWIGTATPTCSAGSFRAPAASG